MLTGRRAFEAEDLSLTLSKILQREPDFDLLPSTIPPGVRQTLRLCLRKDPRQRIGDIRDVRLVLQDAFETAPPEPRVIAPARPSRLPWIVTGLAVTFAIVTIRWAFLAFDRTLENRPLVRLSVDLGPNAIVGGRTTVAISGDGTRIAFPIRGADGRWLLATRLLSQATATPLNGTENGADPFFSPDGQWIGFTADGKLKKISILGGVAVALCDAALMRGAAWGEDGNIIAALSANTGLSRVSAAGGTPQPFTKLQANESTHRWPQILSGGQAVVFTASENNEQYDAAEIRSVSLKTGEVKTLVRGAYFGRYLNGRLIYLQQGLLFGVSFDVERLEARGTPVPLLDGVEAGFGSGSGQFDFSQNGTFVYSNRKAAGGYPVVWLDSSGQTQPLLAQPGAYQSPRVSPDGRQLVVSVDADQGQDLYVYDIRMRRPGSLSMPTAHGRIGLQTEIIFSTGRPTATASGGSAPTAVGKRSSCTKARAFFATPLSPDGRYLGLMVLGPGGQGDGWILPLDLTDPEHPRPGKPEILLQTPANEIAVVFSPDGRWISYASDESGRYELYVRPFQGSAGGKWQISNGGGAYSGWSPDGRQLYFLAMDSRIMVVDIQVKGDSFEVSKPRVWTETPIRQTRQDLEAFDLAPDGKRFAIFPRSEEEAESGSLHVIFAELPQPRMTE